MLLNFIFGSLHIDFLSFIHSFFFLFSVCFDIVEYMANFY